MKIKILIFILILSSCGVRRDTYYSFYTYFPDLPGEYYLLLKKYEHVEAYILFDYKVDGIISTMAKVYEDSTVNYYSFNNLSVHLVRAEYKDSVEIILKKINNYHFRNDSSKSYIQLLKYVRVNHTDVIETKLLEVNSEDYFYLLEYYGYKN